MRAVAIRVSAICASTIRASIMRDRLATAEGNSVRAVARTAVNKELLCRLFSSTTDL